MTGPVRIIPLVATAAVLAVNAAANILPLNGYETGELSALYPTGFTPPGWVFSIWTLIYAGLIAYALWFAFAAELTIRRARSILPAFLVSCAANVAWIVCWHYRLVAASLVVMLALLASLAVIYLRLSRAPSWGWKERLAVDAPFSLYFAWITVATIVNQAVFMADAGVWPLGLGTDNWALVSLVAGVGIFAAITVLTRDVLYGAVFVWAAAGIASTTAGVGEAARIVAGAGAAVIAMIIVVTAFRLVARNRRSRVY